MSLTPPSYNPADVDRHFAQFIGRFGGGPLVAHAADLLSRAVREGHLCLDLGKASAELPDWPSVPQWRVLLAASRAVGRPGDDGVTPLVLDEAGRLYLRRFYEYEQALAAAIHARATPGEIVEGQDAAVTRAGDGRFTLVSGGPGTGKTTTVLRILSAWLQAPGGEECRIALAAPTGKAAARLDEALRDGLAGVPDEAVRTRLLALPRAGTLDRLLGTRPGRAAARYHAGNPLPLDALVVDEASMVALPAMARLFAALPPHARVLLLGDRDQLASVAPGSVLADLVEAAEGGASLAGALVMLRENFRFGNESSIYQLCQAIRTGEGAAAMALLNEPERDDISLAPLPPVPRLGAELREAILNGYSPALREADPARALAALGRFRLLVAVRKGPYGVEGLNALAALLLHQAGVIRREGRVYAGLPVMITRNDPLLGLFNGDIGLVLPEPGDATRRLWVWFPEAGGGVRRIAPTRIPPHEPAYAMTIHKSQGSEFDHVEIVLPERDLPVLTRELLYTGITRARRRVHLWAPVPVFLNAIARKAERTSGLREALLRPKSTPGS